MTERVEEFTRAGKNFMYIDLSGMRSDDELFALYDQIKSLVAKYPEGSLYTITNIEDVRYDVIAKQKTREYLEHNKPYVKCGAVIGLDGVKKVLAAKLVRLSGRKDMTFVFTKEKAIEILLRQES